MDNNYFIKQSHKNAMATFLILFLCLLVVVTIIVVRNNCFHWGYVAFLFITLFICISLGILFERKGVYVDDEHIYYKVITKKEIEIKKIVAIKIIKSEGQVNLAWSPFDLKDRQGNVLYSMICLSDYEVEMNKYPFGDIEFIHKYKKFVVFYSVYDENLLKFLKKHNANIRIID